MQHEPHALVLVAGHLDEVVTAPKGADLESRLLAQSVNPVVKGKVEKECERVLALGSKCLMGGTEKVAALDVLGAERVILKNKTIALSDLLAVYRAL